MTVVYEGLLAFCNDTVTITAVDSGGFSQTWQVELLRGNRPPQASPPYLHGETTVTLTPQGIIRSPAVMGGEKVEVWDPDGDQIFVEIPGIPPQYATSLSAFLASLEAIYFEGGAAGDELCRAVREKDVIVDTFTVILRDACGATTEIPAIVQIYVVDKVPPSILFPAQDKTVECDGRGNTAELSAWLAAKGGALALDNCCPVTWTNDYSPERFVTTCGKAGYVAVTFTAHDCAGNSSSTSATFRIVDTTPPSLQAPPDVTIECDEPVDPSRTGWPSVSDLCDQSPKVTYTDEVLPGAGPQAKVIRRTWRATDACGNPSQAVQVITIVDTKPPEFTYFPEDLDLGCNPPDTSPDTTGWARARDACDPSPTVSFADRASTVGCQVTIERTWAARDACHNASPPAVQRITYLQDTQPPVVTVPGDVTVECHQVPPVGVATATDTCDPAPVVEYLGEERVDGPCPHTYTLIRTWKATDRCGNTAQKTQTITVRDTTPPILTAPPDVDLGCNPADTTPDATGWARATDACDPSPTVSFTDRVSTVGCQVTIERTWTARDACGNSSPPHTQRIRYTLDTTPPVVHCPGNLTLATCLPPGSWVWVNFGITASDNCGPATLVCERSGDWFRVGTTTPVSVICTARDACGNTRTVTCSFLVTVRGNNPPRAWSESVDAPTGVVCIPVPAEDPDFDPLWIEVFDPLPCGTTWVQGTHVCYGTFTCEGGQIPPGTVARFMFRVTDPCGASATGWVYVRILCEICPTALPPEGEP